MLLLVWDPMVVKDHVLKVVWVFGDGMLWQIFENVVFVDHCMYC